MCSAGFCSRRLDTPDAPIVKLLGIAPATVDDLLGSDTPVPALFFPYQYEGYDAAQRQALRSTEIRMRVIAPVP